MTADDIRELDIEGDFQDRCVELLREIAAQLAEINQTLQEIKMDQIS